MLCKWAASGLGLLPIHSIPPFITAFVVAFIDYLPWVGFVQHIGGTETTKPHLWNLRTSSSKSGVQRHSFSSTICLSSAEEGSEEGDTNPAREGDADSPREESGV